ncbi:MAG: FtsX-like permease family protein [Parvibaculaceae bacterium]
MSDARPPLSLAFRFARRELRGGLKGFRVFLACLTLGVAAIAAVGSVSSALVEGLSQEGQTILGGDVDFRLVHREAGAEELAYISRGTTVSKSTEMRAMAAAPATDERTLVELKGVDGLYPLYGEVQLIPAMTLADALEKRDGRWGTAVEPALLDRLGVEVGDRLKVGDIEVAIRAVIEREPDRVAGGFALGPRLFLGDAAMQATGLIRLGSLINYHYRVRLPEDQRLNADVAAWVEQVSTAFPNAGWRIQDRSDSAPGVRRFVERVALFLTLVGLTALVVGGVGVGNAVNSYLDTKREVIATFKCIGAPGGFIFNVYLIQVMALALVGVAIGLVVGGLTPFLVQWAIEDMLPIPARFALYPAPLVLAAGYGVLAALAFAVWPLARAREIPATGLFRDIVAPVRAWPRPAYIAIMAAALGALAALAIGLADRPDFAFWFVVGAAASFVGLRLTAVGLMALAKRAPRFRSPELRLALSNLYRPGAATASVVLSLGLGLTLLVTISLIDGNISDQINGELPERAPSFFFVDIGPDQVEGFEAIVNGTEGVRELNRVPMLRGRVVDINGVPSEEFAAPPDVAWMLKGDRGITYAGALPDGSELVRGSWWAEDYQGAPLISVTEEMARGFGLALGDTLTVNVLGRNLTATVANTRNVDWGNVGINFIFVFSPSALQGAPHTHLATLAMEEAGELDLQRAVSKAYPNITIVRVKEALEAVNGLLEDFAMAVRATSIVTLASGIIVLAGAMAAGHRRRVYDAVVLKVLGATRAKVLKAYIWEYALLGLGTSLVAAAVGSIAAWLVVTQVMEAPWAFLPVTLAVTITGAAVITVALGLLGTWNALSAKAAPVLRAQ